MKSTTARPLDDAARPADIAPATVLAASGLDVVVRDEAGETITARLAVSSPYSPRPGDRLLIARGKDGAWAIAVLAALRAATEAVEAKDGARATLEEGALTVRDGEGRLLFEHRPEEGVSVVHAPHGDLRFSAPNGSIELAAKRAVTIEGERDVKLSGRRVEVGAGGREENRLRFDARGATLSTPELRATAPKAQAAFRDATFAAGMLTTAVDRARHVVGVAETRAERLVSWAKNVYTDVEELAQTRAGRLRQVVGGAYHLSAERTLIKANEDVSIKAERIHLA